MKGFQVTDIDRALSRSFQQAPVDVKNSCALALKKYKALPLQKKVELGFDLQLVRRLEDPAQTLSPPEMKNLSQQILLPLLKPTKAPPPPRTYAGPPPPEEVPADLIQLRWTKLICHDESDECFIFCSEKGGDDEPVAIFLVLDTSLRTRIDLNKLSEDCKAELTVMGLVAAGGKEVNFKDFADRCLKDCETTKTCGMEFNVNGHWIRRTDSVGFMIAPLEWVASA